MNIYKTAYDRYEEQVINNLHPFIKELYLLDTLNSNMWMYEIVTHGFRNNISADITAENIRNYPIERFADTIQFIKSKNLGEQNGN